MLHESRMLMELQRVAWAKGEPLCLYGDPAYHLEIHFQAPFRDALLTPQMQRFNEAMSLVRASVECMFGTITNYYKFVDLKKQLKIGMSPVGKIFLVCGILQNAYTCLYGNLVSDYFNLDPPSLQDYFW